ncbi:MAG: type II secretion system protein [Candidatus Eremiobacteraeota bacterium]|nr:type II secretion system protein [Candidatus Eremiobacteraeota bacterium]MCW5870883.1 type II secretion system protein [Candidatus Eremiobacteraeota bacterium]
MRSKRRGLTVVEVSLACALFGLITLLLASSLKNVGDIWRKTGGKDEAVRNLLKAKSSLQRDLANSGGKAGQWAIAGVGPVSCKDSDALTFLSSDKGQNEHDWTVNPDGSAHFERQITYYGVIPNRPNPGGVVVSTAADAQGYEQQHPFKWLIRRSDPAPTGTPQAINPGWTGWLTAPTSYSLGPDQKVVCDQLLQFRVIRGAPLWILELRAVSVTEVQRKMALGTVPLSQGPFTLTQQFSVSTSN